MGFLSMLYKRSMENPKTPLSNAAIWDAFGVRQSAAGTSVTPENSLEVTSVFAAVRLISNTIATLSLPVYQRTENGKETARNHPYWRLLNERPNPETPSFTFRQTLQAHLLLWGNAYAEVERNGRGDVIALWPIHPTNIRVERFEGKKRYIVRVDGQDVPLSADAVVHIPGFSLDGCMGIVPTNLARNAIGLAKATEEFGSKFFGNGAAPSGVIKHPNSLSEEAVARLRRLWNETQAGLTNAQRTALLDENMSWEPIGVPPEHAQFLETRKFSVAEIARVFGVPPMLLMDLEHGTYTNSEQQGLFFSTYCIEPWTELWEQVLNWALFDENADHFCEFNHNKILRADGASRAALYTALFNVGAMSPNEIRERENMNHTSGGNQRFVPLNMGPLDKPQEIDNAA